MSEKHLVFCLISSARVTKTLIIKEMISLKKDGCLFIEGDVRLTFDNIHPAINGDTIRGN